MMWDWNGPWMHGYGYGGWLMFFGMIATTVAVVLLVVFLIRQASGSGGAGSAGAAGTGQTLQQQPTAAPQYPVPAAESPQDILKRRYANGEIEREEYLQKLQDLGDAR